MTNEIANFDPTTARDELLSRLEAFRHRVWWHVAIAGIARVVATAAALALLSFIIDRTFRLGISLRIVLLIAGLGALAYETWRLILWPLTRKVSFVDLADAMDRNSDGAPLAPRIASVLELTGLLRDPSPPSAAMVQAAVLHASASLAIVDLKDRLDHQRLHINGGAIVGVVVILLLTALLFPSTTGLWARRWFALSREPWPQKTYLQVAGLTDDGRLLVPRGEPATLLVHVKQGSVDPQNIALTIRHADRKGKESDAAMTRFAPGDYRHDLPPVQSPLLVEVEGGDDAVGPITVEPVDRPRVERMELIAQHPTQKEPARPDFAAADDQQDLSFLPHTAMRLVIRATAPLKSISLGDTPDVKIEKRSEREYLATWTHQKAMSFKIELVGAATGLTSIDTPLTIGLKTDQPPRVSLAYSGVRQRITPQATVPMTINARDDYGVHDVQLSARMEFLDAEQKRQTNEASASLFGPQSPAKETDVQLPHRYSIAALKPPVNALVSITTSATDERYLGPQTAKSREATFRIVAPEELFREILLRQQGERAKFRKATDEAERLKTDIAAATTVETMTILSRRHRAMQRESARIGTSLAESLTEMQLNALGSAEAYELMQKNVLAPLKSLNDGLMNQQRDALDAMAAGTALDTQSARARQDEIITQMNAILKNMAQWDSFVDVLNQLNEIIRLQENAKQTTEQLKQKEADSVFDK